MVRFHIYKQTTDSGIAPCATPPTKTHQALLSLAICKPTIRRSAHVGDYIIGLSSTALAKSADAYPRNSIIYIAKVDRKIRGEHYHHRDGEADTSEFRHRSDRIYAYNKTSRRYRMLPNQTGHTESNNMSRELGKLSDNEGKSYKNSWVLLSSKFRYFGKDVREIPTTLPALLNVGRAHRVYKDTDPEGGELNALVDRLYEYGTAYTQDASAGEGARCSSSKARGDTAARKRAHCSIESDGDGKSGYGGVKRAGNRC